MGSTTAEIRDSAFEQFYREYEKSVGRIELDHGPVLDQAQRLLNFCVRADAMLAYSEQTEDTDEAVLRKQLAVGILAGGLSGFVRALMEDQSSGTSAALLMTSMASIVFNNVVPEVFARRNSEPGDSGEALYAEYVRVAAVSCVAYYRAAGFKKGDACEATAKAFNGKPRIIDKLKSASGRQFTKFSRKRIEEWVSHAEYHDRESLRGHIFQFASSELGSESPSEADAHKFANDMAVLLVETMHFASRAKS